MDRPSHAGLRHLALKVRDLDVMKRFYVDVLGFAVEWEPDRDNVYLSSGIDNLALHRSDSLVTSREAGTRSEGRGDGESPLDHLGLIVRSASDVDRWAEFLKQRGITLDALPRTHRDGARSCYFRDPEGNQIQVIHHPPISDKA
jgi:catechol 2,3-dioxygenase-like lactoylglutathione lyase family enzyme